MHADLLGNTHVDRTMGDQRKAAMDHNQWGMNPVLGFDFRC